ncbi:hypothetical protein LCGC14_1768820 [marine sediment metagenome]|uniref:Uncharacterized protein n=1 Tax=marine sediment metagenome TaxID=412755 RepID=A0A0F9HLE7_9ZZZZ
MSQFKVWIHIEEIDEEADKYEDVGLPEPLATYGSLEEAQDLVVALLQTHNPKALDTSPLKSAEAGGPDELLQIATVHVHGGVFGELRLHDNEAAANVYARQLLGGDAITDEQARVAGGEYNADVFVIGIRLSPLDEVRLETWVA